MEEAVGEVPDMGAVGSDTAQVTLSWWYPPELRFTVDTQREMTDVEAII